MAREITSPGETLLQSALALTADGVIAIDAHYRIVFLTPPIEHTFGYPPDAIIGRDVRLLLPEGVPDRWMELGESEAQAENATRWTRGTGRRRDNTEFAAQLRTIETTEAGKRLLLLAVHEKPHAEDETPGVDEALWRNEERYRSMIAALQEGVVLQAADGRILAFNQSAERILGLTENQTRERTSIDPAWGAFRPDGLPFPAADHPAMVTLRTGEPQSNVVMGIHRPDGSLVWIKVNSQPLSASRESLPYGVVASFSDITAGYEVERALREQEELLRKMVEIMPVGVWILDAAGQIVMGNAASQRIWAGARYVGPEAYAEYKAWWPATGQPIAAHEWAAVRALASGETIADELIEIECFDGSHKIILNSAAPVFDANGDIAGGIVVNQDVTENTTAFRLAEHQVRLRTGEIAALLEVSREMAATLELGPLLCTILLQLRNVVDYAGAGIGIVEGDQLRVVEYVGPVPRELMVNQWYRLDGENAYARVVRSRQPIILGDLWSDVPWVQEALDHLSPPLVQNFRDTYSWLGVPLLVKGAIIGVLRMDHTERNFFTDEHARLVSAFALHAAIAIENARLYAEAQRAAVLEERQRLARELHDSVSQALYGIALGTRTAQRLLEGRPQDAARPLQYVIGLAEAAFAEMRALIFELRPDSLESEGLIASLERQIDALRRRHELIVETDLCEEPEAPVQIKEAIYRIVQESTQNTVKHGEASRIDIRLSLTARGDLLLEVGDDGKGFDVTRETPGHLGLKGMRERVEILQGVLKVESDPGRGTRITVRIPITEQTR